MPKGFSDQEKEHIRAGLLEKGHELFGLYGLRKTNIEDLTRAVGISKGAFYLFFDSKEALFAAIIEQFESEYQAGLLAAIGQASGAPRQRFKALLLRAMTTWRDNPLLRQFGEEEYQQLQRKLPVDQVEKLARDDEGWAAQWISAWRATGVALAADPPMLAGLLRALFFVSLHQHDPGSGVTPPVMDLLIDLVVNYLVPETEA